MTTLYLGLDPKSYPNAIHYPVIATTPLQSKELEQALETYDAFTHLIFTSQTAVAYWSAPLTGKTVLAIGPSTAQAIAVKGAQPLIAPSATQEGVIELLKGLPLEESYFLLPRSRLARPILTQFLQESRIRFRAIDLYDTVFQRGKPIPDLSQIDEIIFTSPSTVEGFLRIYGELPSDKKLVAIGPVTYAALQRRGVIPR